MFICEIIIVIMKRFLKGGVRGRVEGAVKSMFYFKSIFDTHISNYEKNRL